MEESVRIGEFWRYAFRLHNKGKEDNSFAQEVTLSFKVNADGEPQYKLDRKILISPRPTEFLLLDELQHPSYETAAFDELWLKVASLLAGYAQAAMGPNALTPQALRAKMNEAQN